MKKLLTLLAAAAVVFAACNKNYEISVDTSSIDAPAFGGVYKVKVNANDAWDAEVVGLLGASNIATVYVEPEQGNGPAEVTLTVAENLTTNPLVAVVVFHCGIAPNAVIAEIKIEQAAAQTIMNVSWGGVDYEVKKLADDNYWFTQNLRYVPEGKTVSTDPNALDNGVWYPVDYATKTLTDNADTVAKKGYLYSTEAALGVAPGTVNDANCLSFEGAQGICPPGWHIPTLDEIANQVGKVAGSKYDAKQIPGPITTAPYYATSGDALLSLANADGFNLDNKNGHVSFNASTQKVNVLNTMSYILASTAKLKDDGTFNNQFYAIMPAATKGGSCNGALFNYKGGAAVRCVKTKLAQ